MALLSAAVGVFAQPAAASTLAGETLQTVYPGPAGHALTVTCGPTAGMLTYHAEGTASGPHLGTFVEDGAATFDPLSGFLLSFDATFSITSAGGNVAGEKHLIPGVFSGDPYVPGSARCGPAVESDVLNSTSICYRAEFAGGGTEVGFSGVFLSYIEPSQGQVGGSFLEDFIPDSTVSCGSRGAEKVTICHRPPGKPGNSHTIQVGAPAASHHLGHGDTPGPCQP